MLWVELPAAGWSVGELHVSTAEEARAGGACSLKMVMMEWKDGAMEVTAWHRWPPVASQVACQLEGNWQSGGRGSRVARGVGGFKLN